MKKHVLQILGRLRRLQWEVEQLQLRECQEQEQQCQKFYQQAEHRLEELCQAGGPIGSSSELAQREWVVSGAFHERERVFKRWLEARNKRLRRLSQMVAAKQKHDIVEALLDHARENERHAHDQAECRALDDFAQSQPRYQNQEAL